MANEKFVFPKEMTLRGLVTPVGTFAFPKLQEPDGKFNADNPQYSTAVRFSGDNQGAKLLLAKIEDLMAQAVAFVAKSVPKKYDSKGVMQPVKEADLPCGVWMEKDSTGGKVPTGEIFLRAKCGSVAKNQDGTFRKVAPALKDKTGVNPWPKNVDIGGGSTGRIWITASPFYVPALGVGVSLRLEAAQIAVARSYAIQMDALEEGEVPGQLNGEISGDGGSQTAGKDF